MNNWTENGEKSILSTLYPTVDTTLGAGVTVSNMFADANYRAFMSEMFFCKENGYFRTTQEEFGVGIINGDYSVFAEYQDDYYITVLDYPRLEEEAVFNSMFAVSLSPLSEFI